MSALRIPGPDGTTILRVIDDGAVGRISHSRLAVHGALVVAESSRDTANRQTREYKAREAEKARARAEKR